MKLLVIGDSVCWGQGLVESHKFSKIVAAALGAPTPENFAHSAAIIGAQNSNVAAPVDGEVPVPLPSIIQQLLKCQDPNDVDLMIVNGGINDVGIGRILSPWTSTAVLDQSVHQHCGLDMAILLARVGRAITKPGARVVVPGYYTILSSDSTHFTDKAQLFMLLEMNGVAAGSLALSQSFDSLQLLQTVVENCHEFFVRSTAELANAVVQANHQFGGNPKFTFVPLPFTDENAVFASHPLLWGLKRNLEAEDEVVAERRPQCDLVYGHNLPKLIQCQRASAGHPNVEGAAKISASILAAL
jgi:lysophospholipase L1-like esterase